MVFLPGRTDRRAGSQASLVILRVTGSVQGVGFRPFVYRLARELGIRGWVQNDPEGVLIEVCASPSVLESFKDRLIRECPPAAKVGDVVQTGSSDPEPGPSDFRILESAAIGVKSAHISADLAICGDCLRELFDSENRRFRYPFINCTNCGPRYSMIRAIPYDRPNTTMAGFKMCDACQAEYDDPMDRRFHAQPNACPDCGPHVELWDSKGLKLALRHEAVIRTVERIRAGAIVAVKGLGGFHLVCSARDEIAVRELRRRKEREEKPFAVMFPSVEMIRRLCRTSALEEKLLLSVQSPIVLIRKRGGENWTGEVCESVAPENPDLGCLLPYTPLHQILMQCLHFPIVATSGNRSDEPLCIDENDALRRLSGLADFFLVHNRPIARHVDDSIVRVVGGREMLLRRARGYAPEPIRIGSDAVSAVALGSHLKNTIAFSRGSDAFISQHIGDLDTEESIQAFDSTLHDLPLLYAIRPGKVITDLHPDYGTSRASDGSGSLARGIQHHYAHVLSCMADNELDRRVLGVSWDGVGLGLDGKAWGGEFLLSDRHGFKRLAHFAYFPLPGGDAASREPRRSALGASYAIWGDEVFEHEGFSVLKAFTLEERNALRAMLRSKINCPETSSVGRLFDSVSSLLGICQEARFEGQAAMKAEYAVAGLETERRYEFEVSWDGVIPWIIDWRKLWIDMRDDVRAEKSASVISASFHNTLAEIIVEVSRRADQRDVVLSGGCFQNRYLSERSIARLKQEGFQPYWHRRVPPNDGGISLGQLVAS